MLLWSDARFDFLDVVPVGEPRVGKRRHLRDALHGGDVVLECGLDPWVVEQRVADVHVHARLSAKLGERCALGTFSGGHTGVGR